MLQRDCSQVTDSYVDTPNDFESPCKMRRMSSRNRPLLGMQLGPCPSDSSDGQQSCISSDSVVNEDTSKSDKIAHSRKSYSSVTPALIREVHGIMTLKTKRKFDDLTTSVQNLKTKYHSLRAVSRRLKMTWGQFQSVYLPRKRRKCDYVRKIDKATANAIRQFYQDPQVTIALPDAQCHGTRFMNMTLRDACILFNQQQPVGKRKVSLSTFTRLRPRKVVKLRKAIPMNTCLCEVCTNFDLLTKSLIGAGMQGIKGSAKAAVNFTLCEVKSTEDGLDSGVDLTCRYGKRKCIYRECDKCGTVKMEEHLKSLNATMLNENRVSVYHKWEYVKRSLKGQIVSRVERVEHSCLLQELLQLYLEKLGELSTHKFLSVWQYEQIVTLSKDLKKGQILISHDFAKNVVIQAQRQVQSSFYGNAQSALCPSVAFYKCDLPNCESVVRHEIINLSPDLRHDSHSFIKFHHDTVKIAQEDNKDKFQVVVSSSDQAPGTFKNHNAMDHISRCSSPTIHFYSGTRHGKGFR